jgi:hypothetical protein
MTHSSVISLSGPKNARSTQEQPRARLASEQMPVPPGKHHLWYGEAHRRLRRQLAGEVAAGLATCARCGEPVNPNPL